MEHIVQWDQGPWERFILGGVIGVPYVIIISLSCEIVKEGGTGVLSKFFMIINMSHQLLPIWDFGDQGGEVGGLSQSCQSIMKLSLSY